MIPIGLDSTHGYRYAEKNMMYETFYGLDALVSFLCCYIGLVFLLICAALLALKQLTERPTMCIVMACCKSWVQAAGKSIIRFLCRQSCSLPFR